MVRKLIPEAEVFVAEENEEIQGFIGLTDTYVAGIFVKSTEQSKGIGTELLIPPGEYETFVKMNEFSENAIRRSAERIDRDPGIVLGRLQNDHIVSFTNVALSKALKHKYKVITS